MSLDRKTLLKKYLEEYGFIGHNIESYNKFVKYTLPELVKEVNTIIPDITPKGVKKVKIKIERVWLEKPSIKEADGTKRTITPMEARIRKLTYQGNLYADMAIYEDGKEVDRETVVIGQFPVMVRSEFCNLYQKTRDELIQLGEDVSDPGGYFIINGTEKVVIIVEDLAPNKVILESLKNSPYTHQAKIYSESGQFKVPHVLEKAKDGMIYLTFTRVNRVPFVVVLKAMGFLKDREILSMISTDEKFQTDLYINLYEARGIKTQEDALKEIGRKMGIVQSERLQMQRAKEVITNYLFPHIGTKEADYKGKALFLARAVKKLLLVSYGDLPETDKDHYSNKRLRLNGDMLESLVRYSLRSLVSDIKYNYERTVKRGRSPAIHSIIRAKLFTMGLNKALGTGQWVGNRTGVSQSMERLNKYSVISHLRRVGSLLATQIENYEARDLHPTHWGKLCTAETPEGTNIGLRKNLALTCLVSTDPSVKDAELVKELQNYGLKGV